jgi:hypothetical protein
LFFFEFDAEKSQPIADPGTNCRRVLPDAASEHQRMQPARRSSECSNSIPPSRVRRGDCPASNSENLMLEEPPLIVSTHGLVGFMDEFLLVLQSQRSQFRARGLAIRLLDILNSWTFRDFDEHRDLFDMGHSPGWRQ